MATITKLFKINVGIYAAKLHKFVESNIMKDLIIIGAGPMDCHGN